MVFRRNARRRAGDGRDFVAIAPFVVQQLLGPPGARGQLEWRWRGKGSFRLKLDTGWWDDFESGEGGGVIEFVMRELSLDRNGALVWLRGEGYLSVTRSGAVGRPWGYSSAAAGSPQSRAAGGWGVRGGEGSKDGAVGWIRAQLLPVSDGREHPIRRWMARRNLWRPELPLPPSLRWVPFDAPVFRGSHSGVGAIAIPLAAIGEWRAAYPDVPSPSAVQLVCIDANGERADYENSQRRRVDKPKFGNARMAVWTVGDVRGDSVTVCEGAADALSLAARGSDPVIAAMMTPRPAPAWCDALSVFESVTLWPDMDDVDEKGRRAGLDAVRELAVARMLAGGAVEVVGVTVGKDAAEAAASMPFGQLDPDELERLVGEFRKSGMVEFEARRCASVLVLSVDGESHEFEWQKRWVAGESY